MDSEILFGTWMRRRRRALDLSQDALAERVGCARITIQKIEAGERRPSREFASLLADHLAVPPDERETFLRAARSELATPQLADPLRSAANLDTPLRDSGLPAAVATGNLPAHLTPCIGRARELAQLDMLLADPTCRLITIAGPGGVGKTHLATAAAAAHVAAFRDGVWFVVLSTVASAEYVVAAIADVMGVARDPTADPVEQLAFSLCAKQFLLVLDNAEHAVFATAVLLARLLRGVPGVKVIVTSRERLRLQGEWLIELEGLSYPEEEADSKIDTSSETSSAVQLFVRHAQMVRPDFVLGPNELRHVARLCRLLEGLPLAIELAAGWMRLHSCQALVEHIAQGLDVSALAPRDLPERQRSLQAVFNYSWELLSESERAALSRLAVFRGPFDLIAAEVIADAPVALLAALLDKSLLRRSGDERYMLHALVRQYASARLAADGDEQERTRARHAAYFAAQAHMPGGASVVDITLQTLGVLSTVFVEVRTAWEWALARRETMLVGQMLDGLRTFCLRESLFYEGVDLFGQAVLSFEGVASADAEVRRLVNRLLVRQAIFYLQLSLVEQARLLLSRGLATARQMSDLPEVALCLQELAGAALIEGAYGEAQRYLWEALAIRDAMNDELAVSVIRSALGLIAYDLGEYAAARRLCQAALDIARSGKHSWLAANAALRLSYVEYALGNYPLARTLIEAALVDVTDAGWLYGVVHLHSALGLILAAQSERTAAEDALRAALSYARACNYPFGIALALNHLGYVLSQQGAYTEARELLQESLALCQAAQNRVGIAYALAQLGEVACATGDMALAERHLLGALETATAVGVAPLILDVLVGLALLAARREEYREALRLLALPLVHLSSWAVTRARAEQLRATLELRLPPDVTAQTLEAGQAHGMVEVINGLLEPRAGAS